MDDMEEDEFEEEVSASYGQVQYAEEEEEPEEVEEIGGEPEFEE